MEELRETIINCFNKEKLLRLAHYLDLQQGGQTDEEYTVRIAETALKRLERYERVIEKLKTTQLAAIELLKVSKKNRDTCAENADLTHYCRDELNDMLAIMLRNNLREYASQTYLKEDSNDDLDAIPF